MEAPRRNTELLISELGEEKAQMVPGTSVPLEILQKREKDLGQPGHPSLPVW